MAALPLAVVTGCGKGGIGHAVAKQLKERSYHVIATRLASEDGSHLDEIGVQHVPVDVTKQSDIDSLRDIVEKISGGSLAILVNNAGVCYNMPAVDHDVAEIERMFNVNVFGAMRMVKSFYQMIINAEGVIVNIGSIRGIVPYIYGAGYNASKAALHHYGNTLRAELKPFGVRVVTIISGEVSTNLLKPDQQMGRSIPEDSIFAPLREDFQEHLNRKHNDNTPEQYATAVVKEIVKKNPVAWYYFGEQAVYSRIMCFFLPRTFWDWLFAKMFHFSKLSQKQKQL